MHALHHVRERLRHLGAGAEKRSGWVARRPHAQICHSADAETLTALHFGYSQRRPWIIYPLCAHSSVHKEFVQGSATGPESLLKEPCRAKCFYFSPRSFSRRFPSEICWRYYKPELLDYKFLPDKLFCKQFFAQMRLLPSKTVSWFKMYMNQQSPNPYSPLLPMLRWV